MKILADQPIRNCFDGKYMRHIVFDQPIDYAFIAYMAKGLELDYYADFPTPFYKIEKKENFIVKGVEGNAYLRIYYSRLSLDSAREYFENSVKKYSVN